MPADETKPASFKAPERENVVGNARRRLMETVKILRRYWGYSAFRPLQEHIVQSLLAGRDTCVVMPTGGGKSLCYQLPAAMSPGKMAVVVSPLIALMQDQVAQLDQMGIAAAFLNSSISTTEQGEVVQAARKGKYRLIYISPERLARADTLEWLRKAPLSFFAIDEAHCISEWGHEFRPDYRHLSRLRAHFPDRPIAAFTASATRRVRHDIIDQLQLRDPDKYIASFYRANLRYVVQQCDSGSQMNLLLAGLRSYPDGNVIVYAPTIDAVESTTAILQANGIPALPYHGQMDAADRKQHQERWMLGEPRVMVGTIAFGLGINKPDVRAVIHLSLPKSIEQYYQEAGRAGRDGQPADCVLLWRKSDAGLHAYFVGQVNDSAERERSWQRYHEIRGFVESPSCRHQRVCQHFGETKTWSSCHACDACGYVPDWLKQAAFAPAPQSSGTRLKSRAPHTSGPRRASWAENERVDPELRDFLRQWRIETAKRESVPAFLVLHDTTLDDLCRVRPASMQALRTVSGIGERKAEKYGASILNVFMRFRGGERAASR